MKKFRIIVMLLMTIIMGASFVSCNPGITSNKIFQK